MKEYKLNLSLFFSSIAIFAIIIVGMVLCFTGKFTTVEILRLLLNYSFITIPLSLIWLYFQKIGWRIKFWKWLAPFLHFPPDIRGRWEGTLDRKEEGNPHKFVIEIKQTMTEIKVYTYSEKGQSESIIDNISCDKMGDDFYLCYLWEGETANFLPKQKSESGRFKGYTILKLIDNCDEKKLIGEYFTNRRPIQTMGCIDVKWQGLNLLKQY